MNDANRSTATPLNPVRHRQIGLIGDQKTAQDHHGLIGGYFDHRRQISPDMMIIGSIKRSIERSINQRRTQIGVLSLRGTLLLRVD